MGPREDMESPGPRAEKHKASWEKGGYRNSQAETKVLSALLLGTEGFQPRVPCPQSNGPAMRKSVSPGRRTRAAA